MDNYVNAEEVKTRDSTTDNDDVNNLEGHSSYGIPMKTGKHTKILILK